MPQRLILAAVTAAVAAGVPLAAAPVQVAVEVQGSADGRAGEIVVRDGGEAGSETTYPLAEALELEGLDPTATVSCRGVGLWCPEVALGVEVVRLPVFAAMTVSGAVAGNVAGAVRTGTVQGVVRGEGNGETFELRARLAVDDGRFEFTAPRTQLDLRFAFPGATPVYRWGVEPPEPIEVGSARVELGRLTLEPGGSVSGWVRRRDDELPVEGATVVARPVANPESGPVPRLRTWEASTEENGFFQVRSLAPGAYRLELDARDLVAEVVEPVEIESGSETLLGAVLLRSPFQVSVQVSPALHPTGALWTIAFRRVNPAPEEEAVEVTADDAGIGETSSLVPADYWVQVRSPDGDVQTVERHHLGTDQWLLLEVPLVQVEGSVRLGGDPVEASVALMAGTGDRVVLESDEGGEFVGWMRRPERPWVLATVQWMEGEEARKREVELYPSLDDNVLELEIDLPAGTVYGEVVDAEGRPQRNLRVVATPAAAASRFTEVRVQTDRNGRFHLTGLDATEYFVQAGGKGRAASEVVRLDLAADLPIGEVRLVVWPTRRLDGTLTLGSQVIGGARVELNALGPVPVVLSSTTDGEGRFAFDVPEAVELAVMTVEAPSHLLWSGCVAIEGNRVSLDLPAVPPASLLLRLRGRGDLPPLLNGKVVLVTGDGGFVTYNGLVHWSRRRNGVRRFDDDGDHGTELLEVPAVAPTSYALSFTTAPDWILAAQTCSGAFPDADWSSVGPGGRVELGYDSSELQEQALRKAQDAGR